MVPTTRQGGKGMKQVHKEDGRESMQILRGLAMEIQDMDETQRLKTLEWAVQKETRGEGSRFWLIIAKVLLARPDLIPRALQLSNRELQPPAKVLDFKLNVEQLANRSSAPHSRQFLNSFFHILSEG